MIINLTSIRWILFDAVGTLIHPTEPIPVVYQRIGQQFGSSLSVKEVQENFRQAFMKYEHNGDSETGVITSERLEMDRWKQIVKESLPHLNQFDQAYEKLFHHYSQPAAWRLFDDVSTTLSQLRQSQLNIAVASNFDSRLHAVISGLGISQQLNLILPASELGYRKPSIQFFERAQQQIGCDYSQILSVGDQPDHDLIPAQSLGMKAILIDRGGSTEFEFRINQLCELTVG